MTPGVIAHMENHVMKLPVFPHLRSAKFVPFALASLFCLTNFPSLFFHNESMPVAVAATIQHIERIPLDIPVSGNCDLDWIIFRAGQHAGVDPRFIHAVIQQESRYDPKATSPVGARGLMQLMPATAKKFKCDDPANQPCNVTPGPKYLPFFLHLFNA